MEIFIRRFCKRVIYSKIFYTCRQNKKEYLNYSYFISTTQLENDCGVKNKLNAEDNFRQFSFDKFKINENSISVRSLEKADPQKLEIYPFLYII